MSGHNVQSLGEGGQESILALIQAIAPELANNSGGHLTSDEVANRLTNKLAELVGPESAGNEKRNERGELVNEEGLPIVEISERLDPTDLRTSTSRPTPVTVEPLIPLASLSDHARARLRAKRNQILDLLEKEENDAELAQQRREAEEQESSAKKRREEVAKEKERLKDAREFQKKMGRALLQNVSKAKEKERQEREAQRLKDEEADLDRKRSPTAKKKTVAFAERTEQIDRSETESESVDPDWGDVTSARLTRKKRPTLLSQALLDQHPMKMKVVERTSTQITSQATGQSKDSDDDSDQEFLPDSSQSEEEPTLETDEIDFDTAQHQREIALEYYNKRNTFGKVAAQVMVGPEVGTLPDYKITHASKPAVSNFKANRLVSAYNASAPSSSQSQSISLDDNVLSVPSARKVQRSIRSGKLDSEGRLVGGDVDSNSEDEIEGLQDMLELIRKGEIYNIGPSNEYIHAVPPASVVSPSPPNSSIHPDSLAPPSMRSNTSKFKASRTSAGRPIPASISVPETDVPSSAPLSSSTTPISYERRSSPKLNAPTALVITPTVEERQPHLQTSGGSDAGQVQCPRPIIATPNQVTPDSPFPAIIESPSFPLPSDSKLTFPILIDSPSFPNQAPSRPNCPPVVLSMGISKDEVPQQPFFGSNIDKNGSSTRMSNPVSSSLPESTSPVPSQIPTTGQDQKAKKISRFKAERMS